MGTSVGTSMYGNFNRDSMVDFKERELKWGLQGGLQEKWTQRKGNSKKRELQRGLEGQLEERLEGKLQGGPKERV